MSIREDSRESRKSLVTSRQLQSEGSEMESVKVWDLYGTVQKKGRWTVSLQRITLLLLIREEMLWSWKSGVDIRRHGWGSERWTPAKEPAGSTACLRWGRGRPTLGARKAEDWHSYHTGSWDWSCSRKGNCCIVRIGNRCRGETEVGKRAQETETAADWTQETDRKGERE